LREQIIAVVLEIAVPELSFAVFSTKLAHRETY
jgi:hypothetical protein